jgi:hypothetical protein
MAWVSKRMAVSSPVSSRALSARALSWAADFSWAAAMRAFSASISAARASVMVVLGRWKK